MKSARKAKKSFLRSWYFTGLLIVLLFAVSFAAGSFLAEWGIKGFVSEAEEDESEDVVDLQEMPERLNVLLLGIDARKGEKDGRTDSMMLVSIDRETKKVAVVSIPRDTLVDIPGHGSDKVNAANALGGARLARRTVENLLKIEIPYYVKTNFAGFKEIVDTLGGVEIEVEKAMYYPAEGINLKPGLQRLNGDDALGYVRYRNDALGDIARVDRQQKFMTALAKEMLKAKTIIKLPVLIPKLLEQVETNLRLKDALLLAQVAANLEADNIVTATLPGTFLDYKGTSYWKMDTEKSRDLLAQLFAGVKVATITGPEIKVPADKPAQTQQTGSDSEDSGQDDEESSDGSASGGDGTGQGNGGKGSGKGGKGGSGNGQGGSSGNNGADGSGSGNAGSQGGAGGSDGTGGTGNDGNPGSPGGQQEGGTGDPGSSGNGGGTGGSNTGGSSAGGGQNPVPNPGTDPTSPGSGQSGPQGGQPGPGSQPPADGSVIQAQASAEAVNF